MTIRIRNRDGTDLSLPTPFRCQRRRPTTPSQPAFGLQCYPLPESKAAISLSTYMPGFHFSTPWTLPSLFYYRVSAVGRTNGSDSFTGKDLDHSAVTWTSQPRGCGDFWITVMSPLTVWGSAFCWIPPISNHIGIRKVDTNCIRQLYHDPPPRTLFCGAEFSPHPFVARCSAMLWLYWWKFPPLFYLHRILRGPAIVAPWDTWYMTRQRA